MEDIFSYCVEELQKNMVNGLFLVLGNDKEPDQAAEYLGFFVRDSDEYHQSENNTDLLTVAEVKEIMDEAIEHSQKANVKHLARRVFGRSTDESDRIILKEEDFKI